MNQSVWWKKAIIYELYVDKFAGSFKNLTAKLDYFTYLGVNVLWLLPHYPSPMVDGGYDISDYKNIRPDLGTLADFEDFISQAHTKGLKVMIDLVLNHTSDQHPWFTDSTKRDWYLRSGNQNQFGQAFVHFAEIKNHNNWIFNPATNDYYYATFYPQQPDLNWDNPQVVTAMQDIIDFWLHKGVDGLRLDAVSRLVKREGTYCFGLPETHQILKNIRSHIDAQFPGVVLLAESGGWPDEARQFFGAGDECHLVLHFPLSVRILSAIKNHDTAKVSDVWTWSGQIPDGCAWAGFLTSHDSIDMFFLENDEEKRELIQRVDPEKIFSSPDGQSVGARLAEVCQNHPADILWATKTLLEQPVIPIIYYGNEISMRNLTLPQKPSDFRDYVRGPFDWIEAQKQQQDPNSLLNSIREAIKSRKE
jgi:maltose alpha-D-glucosyltransferase / alpha-amylase